MASSKAEFVETRPLVNKFWEVSQEPPVFAAEEHLLERVASVFVDASKTGGEILGFGCAITDAAAEVWSECDSSVRSQLLEHLFSDSGLCYTVVRTHMNSCDFSTGSYTYVNDGDSDLTSFDISQDDKFRLPMIQEAQKMIEKNHHKHPMTLYFAPWSAPAWMKDSCNQLGGGKLLNEYYQPWAEYFLKYVQELEKRNIKVWGLSVQNESLGALPWEAMVWTPDEQKIFVRDHLGPTLEKAGYGHIKIMIFDHNRDLAVQFATPILQDPVASKYIWGVAIHWYETWFSSSPLFDNILALKERFPEKEVLFTEGCIEQYTPDRANDLGLGERYAHHILQDLRRGVTGWTDWNCLLNKFGGPNHLNNLCAAPIMVDKEKEKHFFTMPYWYIGHFSRYIKPGARRIIAVASRSDLENVAFLNPDNRTIVVVILNRSEKTHPYILQLDGHETRATSHPHSIVTWIVNRDSLNDGKETKTIASAIRLEDAIGDVRVTAIDAPVQK